MLTNWVSLLRFNRQCQYYFARGALIPLQFKIGIGALRSGERLDPAQAPEIVYGAGKVFGCFQSAFDERLMDDKLWQ